MSKKTNNNIPLYILIVGLILSLFFKMVDDNIKFREIQEMDRSLDASIHNLDDMMVAVTKAGDTDEALRVKMAKRIKQLADAHNDLVKHVENVSGLVIAEQNELDILMKEHQKNAGTNSTK